MAILPVVGLEQVIVQSPAMLPERAKEQRKEEGPASEQRASGNVQDRDDLAPLAAVDRVHPVDSRESPDEGLEKEIISEYAPKKERRKNASKKPVSENPGEQPDGTGQILNIEV